MRITILGAGAMGAALTKPLADRGHDTRLWATPYDLEALEAMRTGRAHPALGVAVPATVNLYGPEDLRQALAEAECVILAVSTRGVLPVMETCLSLLPDSVPLVNAAKGFVELEGRVLLVADALRLLSKGMAQPPRVLNMAGPSIASELAQGHWTAVCLGGGDAAVAQQLAEAMETDYFGIQPVADAMGLEICAAFKNMYAIALAWPEGRGQGGLRNLKGILYLQVLNELKVLVAAGGGDSEIVMGLPGLGDFIATAAGGRNGQLGRHLGAGKSLHQALTALNNGRPVTVEGLDAARLARRYLESLDGVAPEELPLFTAIGEVLNHELSVDEALRRCIPKLGIFGESKACNG